tara:strand:- start:192064 stop:192216 length:153 start_codon:yes stop_codon:yes gene_type:complete
MTNKVRLVFYPPLGEVAMAGGECMNEDPNKLVFNNSDRALPLIPLKVTAK